MQEDTGEAQAAMEATIREVILEVVVTLGEAEEAVAVVVVDVEEEGVVVISRYLILAVTSILFLLPVLYMKTKPDNISCMIML
jgi:hypothetical protein